MFVNSRVAKWVADAFGRDSIYDTWLQDTGYPYLNPKKIPNLSLRFASDLMTSNEDFLDVEEMYTIEDLEAKCNRMGFM